MVLEFQGADGVGDLLDGIRLSVGPVIHGVDAPGCAGPGMGRAEDPVHDGITQVEVSRRHIDLRPEDARSVGIFPRPHPSEEIEVLLDRPAPIRTFLPRFGQRSPVLADLIGRQVADVGLPLPDERFGELVELLEIVRGVVFTVSPVEPQPFDVRLDGVDVFHVFLAGVGVVETEVAEPVVVLGDPEVEADGFGVADVEITVRFGREAGVHAPGITAAGVVTVDDLPDKIGLHGEDVFRRGGVRYGVHGIIGRTGRRSSS